MQHTVKLTELVNRKEPEHKGHSMKKINHMKNAKTILTKHFRISTFTRGKNYVYRLLHLEKVIQPLIPSC